MKSSVPLATMGLLLGSIPSGACSQGGITGKAAPQAILDARLDQGEGNTCALPGAGRRIGGFGTPSGAPPSPVADGTQSTGVICTVHDEGGGKLAVTGEMFVNGERWFTIHGTLPGSYDGTANPKGILVPGVRVSMYGTDGTVSNTYGQNDGCTLVYGNASEGTAAGRAWGFISCPRAEKDGQSDAGDPTMTCTINAFFRFEDCSF